MKYRLDELAKLAAELGLAIRRPDAHNLEVVLYESCVLVFWNMPTEQETLVGFDGTAWHSHGTVLFMTGGGTYVEYDELDILIALGAGELVVISEFKEGALHDRWLAHRKEPVDLRYVWPGEELRVYRLPEMAARG